MAEDIKTLVSRWVSLTGEREKLAIQDQDLVTEISMIRERIFLLMENLGTQNMKFDEGTVYMKASGYPKLLKDPEEVIKWFDSVGRPEVAPRKVLLGRIKDYIADCIDQDKPFPPEDMIEVKPIKEIHIQRNKATKGAK